MHEFGIARDIVCRAVQEAQRHQATGIASLSILLGLESGASKDALAFGIEAASQGTLAQGASVRINETRDGGVVLESIELTEA